MPDDPSYDELPRRHPTSRTSRSRGRRQARQGRCVIAGATRSRHRPRQRRLNPGQRGAHAARARRSRDALQKLVAPNARKQSELGLGVSFRLQRAIGG
jgi:hypothetical protein